MKKEFKSFNQQMTYVNRYINRYTDIEMVCQYCGNKGRIRYYRECPSKVQIVCLDCSNKKGLSTAFKLGKVVEDIPLIDVEEHIVNKTVLNKMIGLNKDTKKILRDLLKSDKPKYESFKDTGLTMTVLNRLIDEYVDKVDPEYKDKLAEHFTKVRDKKIREVKLKSVTSEDSHPITKIKLERSLTNADIVKLSNNRITVNALCMIQERKSKPKLVTKIILAEALGVSVSTLFPEDTEFSNVYCWSDYWYKIRNNVSKSLSSYVLEKKKERSSLYT